MSDSEQTTISQPYLEQLIEEAVGRWVAMCKPILGNWKAEDVPATMRKGEAWPWNEGLSHSAFVQREFWAAIERDRRRTRKEDGGGYNWSA